MATIATLAAKVTANASQFEGAMEKIGKRLDNLRGHVNALMSPIDKFNALMATVGILAVTYYIQGIIKAQIETLHFARMIGDTVRDIDILNTALRKTGQDGAIAQDVLGQLSKTLAAGATGNVAIAEVFERIGLDVAKLNQLTPSQAFWVIAEQISKIADAETRAAIATQIFGDKAVNLMGILSKGKGAADEAAKKVDMFGRAASDIEITKLELAYQKFQDIEAAVKAAAIALAVNLAPTILEIAKNIEAWTPATQNAVSGFARAGRIAMYIYMLINDIWQLIKLVALSIAAGIVKGFGFALDIVIALSKGMLNLARDMNKLGLISDKVVTTIGRNIENFKDAKEASQDAFSNLKENANDILQNKWIDLDKFDNAFNGIQNGANKAAEAFDKTARGGNNAAAAAYKYAELFKKGMQITTENLSPTQKFQSTLQELDKLLDVGAISWDTYGRAVAKATAELESAYNMRSISLPQALRYGSGQDISAYNKSKLEYETRTAESPAQRLERLQKQGITLQQQQLDYTRDIANAARNRKVYDIK